MKCRVLLLVGLFCFEVEAHASAVATARVRIIPPERFVDLGPGEYRSSGVTIQLRRPIARKDAFGSIVDIRSPGRRPLRLVIDDHDFHRALPKFGVGRLGRNSPPVVFIQTYSGGGHCCVTLRFVSASRSEFAVAKSPSWDGVFIEQWPKDIDGDGRADIVRNDNRFLYAFTSYAMSYPPPVILNVIGHGIEDVSTKPGFRKLFAEDLRDARAECLKRGSRGACAAYVADAARVGDFQHAWSEMLRAYDRKTDWGYPNDCHGNATLENKCKDGKSRFRNYPDALLHFLKRTGYVVDDVQLSIIGRG